MPTKQEVANRNIKKIRRSRATKKFFKRVFIIIAIAIALFLACVAGTYIAHYTGTNHEIEVLKENELYRLVEVEDDRYINVVDYGNPNSEHTIVTISSVGTNDFSVYVQNMLKPIKDDIRAALIDRAGHGMSDDSFEKQTLDKIISDYRTALQKAGIEGPYILLAQQFGGVYATYWEMQYPDEVEAIIYIDGTIIHENTQLKPLAVENEHKIKSFIYKIGFQRLYPKDVYSYSSDSLLSNEAECTRIMNTHSVCTAAYLSEMELMNSNFTQVLDELTDTDAKKMYISSSLSFTTIDEIKAYCKHKNDKNNELGIAQFYNLSQPEEKMNEDINKMIAECTKRFESEVVPFVSQLGNCQLTRIPGDTKLYEQNPGAILEAIVDFIMYVDADIPEIKDYYDDSLIVDWEQYREDHIAEFKEAYGDGQQEQSQDTEN